MALYDGSVLPLSPVLDSDHPGDEIRFDYPLADGARVLDVGGYLGQFASRFVDRYGAHVTVFEPVPQFAALIREKFAGEPRVRVIEAALADSNGCAEFDLDADASGFFGASGGQRVPVTLLDAADFFGGSKVGDWDLVKLNIEGGEYALLERLVETGHIARIRHLQVQCHLNVPAARERYCALARKLRRTHNVPWRYPFVWESWIRRDGPGGPG